MRRSKHEGERSREIRLRSRSVLVETLAESSADFSTTQRCVCAALAHDYQDVGMTRWVIPAKVAFARNDGDQGKESGSHLSPNP